MQKHGFLFILVLLLADSASAQSCFSLAKDSAAYQTCMLRTENNRREQAAEERVAADQRQRNSDEADRKYKLLLQRAEVVRELNKLCAANPAEDCESLASKAGLLQKYEALKAEAQ